MGDYRDNNTDPNARGQHYEQGFWPSPQTLPPNVQQTQYYEQGFWQPPQALLPTVQHTWMPPSTDDRAFGYDSHPNQLQGPYSGAADQHPYLHGFGHIQPSPPQPWGYNDPSQVPSPFHVRDHTLDLNSSDGMIHWHSQIQHQPDGSRQPSLQKRPWTRLSVSDAADQPSPQKHPWAPLSISIALQRSPSRSVSDADNNASISDQATYAPSTPTIPKPSDSGANPTTGTINERKPPTFYAPHER
ncbi:hypothetical protein FA13DRAFT_1817972 [Coprinellus micaceus]|uniref:Uncharacterized protein n=1 Tax=Coprinellus micaceus TaxID=71717 RepID=A0A4Y7SRE2_COPMI|nr:hypothetical protein FA13DRAFT_1817972 [Coprinellus micaceus]